MTGKLTTHALDTVRGIGAGGLAVTLRGPGGAVLATATLGPDGRAVLLEGPLARGVYELDFAVAAYHRAHGDTLTDPPFLDVVTLRFGLADPDAHLHVPLLLSPYSFTSYRGC